MFKNFTIGFLFVAAMASAQQFPSGTRLRLTAVPAADATFVGWSGAVTSTANPIELVLTADASVTATFMADEPPPPPPPTDPELTVTVVGPGTVTVVVVPPDPPPPPPGAQAAQIQCPDAAGVFGIPTTTISNDPVAQGCIAATVPMSTFFAAAPYNCANLKPGLFYTGRTVYAASRVCQDVTTPEEFKLAQNFTGTQQMVAIVHNDLTITDGATQVPWLASKGELLIIGVPDANGKPPTITHPTIGTVVNWQSTSGNLAIANMINVGELGFGSAHLLQQQTLTLMGVTQTIGPGRLVLTRYEGGGGAVANDPTLPIDDEVYFKNVLVKAGPNSHNVYLDRNGIQYIEGLISYGNGGDGNHPLKLDGRLAFLYGSWLSSAGVHDVLPADNSGQSPLSSVACQQGVIKDNHFLDAVGVFGGVGAVTAQVRTAIAACDYPQGWKSNTYPTVPYTGPIVYRGQSFTSSPYWDPAWWAGVAAAGTSPPQLYSNPDMLVVYHIGNTYEVLNSGTTTTTNYHGIISDPTFPMTYPSTSSTNQVFPAVAPPDEWFERARSVVVNGCFVSGNPAKVANHWPGSVSCTMASAPAWLAGYHECATGGTQPDATDKFVMVGSNECGISDPIPQEVSAAVAALELIPNPPWRQWN